MDFPGAIKSGFRKYIRFSGRASRSEYWYWFLFSALGEILFATLDLVHNKPPIPGQSASELFSNIWLLATFLPSVAMSVRRLHDINRRGWWILINFVPIIGFILILIWDCTKGTQGPNNFGHDPLSPIADNVPVDFSSYTAADIRARTPGLNARWIFLLIFLFTLPITITILFFGYIAADVAHRSVDCPKEWSGHRFMNPYNSSTMNPEGKNVVCRYQGPVTDEECTSLGGVPYADTGQFLCLKKDASPKNHEPIVMSTTRTLSAQELSDEAGHARAVYKGVCEYNMGEAAKKQNLEPKAYIAAHQMDVGTCINGMMTQFQPASIQAAIPSPQPQPQSQPQTRPQAQPYVPDPDGLTLAQYPAACEKQMGEYVVVLKTDTKTFMKKNSDYIDRCVKNMQALAKLHEQMPIQQTSSAAMQAPQTAQAAPTAAAPTPQQICEKRLTDYAIQQKADPKQYVTQNQAYIQKCVQYMNASANAPH